MVDFTKSTPREDAKIAGEVFQIPAPFKEGHACANNEAAVLNQTLRENVRNNMASTLKKHKENGSFDASSFQAAIDNYVKSYEFGARRGGGGRAADPVDREMRNIARNHVKEALQKKGHKIGDVPTDEINGLIDGTLEKYGEQLRSKAERIVAAREEATAELAG